MVIVPLELKIKIKKVYSFLKRDIAWVKRNLPSLYDWIPIEVKNHNKRLNIYSKTLLREPIKQAVQKLRKNNVKLTHENILQEIGYKRYILQRYPFLRDYINEFR